MTSRDYLTIGEVVQKLQGAYPDLSISKLRFLEEEGLIAPGADRRRLSQVHLVGRRAARSRAATAARAFPPAVGDPRASGGLRPRQAAARA